jgi:hypothetical protein
MNPSNVLTTRVAEVVQARSRVSHSQEMTIVPGSPSGLPRVDSSDFALCLPPSPLPRRGYLILRRPHRCAHRTWYTSLVMAPLSGTTSSARQSATSAHAAASSCSSPRTSLGIRGPVSTARAPGSGSRSPPSSLNLPRSCSPPARLIKLQQGNRRSETGPRSCSPPARLIKLQQGNRRSETGNSVISYGTLLLFQTQFGFLLNGTKWSEAREKRG